MYDRSTNTYKLYIEHYISKENAKRVRGYYADDNRRYTKLYNDGRTFAKCSKIFTYPEFYGTIYEGIKDKVWEDTAWTYEKRIEYNHWSGQSITA